MNGLDKTSKVIIVIVQTIFIIAISIFLVVLFEVRSEEIMIKRIATPQQRGEATATPQPKGMATVTSVPFIPSSLSRVYYFYIVLDDAERFISNGWYTDDMTRTKFNPSKFMKLIHKNKELVLSIKDLQKLVAEKGVNQKEIQ